MTMPLRAARLETAGDVTRRIRELRSEYAPFTRNLVSPLDRRVCSAPLNPWRFRHSPAKNWSEITIPEYKGAGYWQGEYEGRFTLPENLRACPRVVLLFQGVETDLTARLNDAEVGRHSGGSDPFALDVSDVVDREGENRVHLTVVNGLVPIGTEYERSFSRQPYLKNGETFKLVGEWGNLDGRACRSGGIWRDILFVGMSDPWVESVLVDPDPDRSRVSLRIRIGSREQRETGIDIAVHPRNFGGETARTRLSRTVLPGITEIEAVVDIADQRLWTPQEPCLYVARVTVSAGREPGDGLDTIFGQRRFVYDPQIARYRLNGKPHRFRGCATINSLNSAYLRGDTDSVVDQILLAKAAGFTILRHHILSPIEEIDVSLDMYGMMSQPEMPIWGLFHAQLEETAVQQLERIVRQHYNHPSTVLFALSSETGVSHPGYAAYQRRAIQIMERQFPGLEWKIEGVRGNNGGIAGPLSEEGCRLEYKDRLFDLHEYAGWYVSLGNLEPVRDGETLLTIGEFGAESLSGFQTMEKCWPPGSYPADPVARVTRDELPFGPQYSWSESRWFLPTPRTLGGWIEATQTHAAFVHEYMADLYRRSPSVLGYHQYFLNEPVWNTWRKTLCDVDLVPKQPYFAMARANEPVSLRLFAEQSHYVRGDEAVARVFVANDSDEDIDGAEVSLFHLSPGGDVLGEESLPVSARMARPVELPALRLPITDSTSAGSHRVEAFLVHKGATLSDCTWRFDVLEAPECGRGAPSLSDGVLHFAGSAEGLAVGRHLAAVDARHRCSPLAEIAHRHRDLAGAPLVIDGCSDWGSVPTRQIREHVVRGGRLLIREAPPGSLSWICPGLEVTADPSRAQFRIDTNHPVFRGLAQEDFRLWNFIPARGPLRPGPLHPYVGRRTRDLVDCPVRLSEREFDRVVQRSRDGSITLYSIADADRRSSALLEIRLGDGCILISQARVFERYFEHPLARLLYHRELEYLCRADHDVSREKFDIVEILP